MLVISERVYVGCAKATRLKEVAAIVAAVTPTKRRRDARRVDFGSGISFPSGFMSRVPE